MKKLLFILTTGAICINQLQGAAFNLGNLVVVQAGDGSAALNNASTAAFLKEFTTAGSLVQTINMPVAASGLNQPLTLSGSATSEGFLALSTDGQYLTLGGYGIAPGTTSVANTAVGTVNRVVGRVNLSGTVDTTTVLGDAYSGSNIRSAVSTDGTSIWTAGNGGSGLGATAGTRYTTVGSTTSIQLNPTTSNNRVVNIFDGQLYVSTASGTSFGISTVGTGLPTAAGSGGLTLLPGFPTTGRSPYDFWFRDASTLYVADDGSAANLGGIQKWVESSGTWSLAYTLLNTGSTTTGVRGLIGTVDDSGNTVLYGTTAASSANNLISLIDTGAGSTASVLATAPVNTAFRGVEFIPVPEPASAAMLLIGGALFYFRRRR